MDAVVAPVLHKYDAPAFAVNTTFCPAQKDVGPFAEILATVGVRTVIAVDAVLVHPAAFVTLTV
jgi:hypothetical protein